MSGNIYCGADCPICGQGGLHRVRITNCNNVEVYLCSECDALWFGDKDGARNGYERFEEFMEKWGLIADWKQVVILE
jgi:hypothetical protein